MRNSLYLYNTLTGKKELFKPRRDKEVKMFTCGPSIYARPHVGNYRSFLYEDVLQRYLEYLGYNVQRLINFTDVEDKAIVKAREKNLTREKLITPNAEQFMTDAAALKIKLPPHIARSSTSVDQAVHLIERLIEKGYAYRHKGDVFFDPLKFKGFGRLFGLDMGRWPKEKRRFRRDTYTGMRWNLGDFILWHDDKSRGNEGFSWDTAIGRGRPAWNIQDAAMITKHLGCEIDICCGGVDNLYRHHDYTLAIMDSLLGREFAHYWLHGEHVIVNGAKMSKSKGNIVYLQELLKQGFSAEHVRFFLVREHYRKKLDLTGDRLREAAGRIDSIRSMTQEIRNCRKTKGGADTTATPDKLTNAFERKMNDDLDVKGAVDEIESRLAGFVALTRAHKVGRDACEKVLGNLKRIDQVLQVLLV
ncbi:MAG: hypothetical protein C4560_12085 [Nitrospiraceae bacterium]|nr:MAG: hypothetical protein C4560_12085 [Nitrospiraceae bacterium]